MEQHMQAENPLYSGSPWQQQQQQQYMMNENHPNNSAGFNVTYYNTQTARIPDNFTDYGPNIGLPALHTDPVSSQPVGSQQQELTNDQRSVLEQMKQEVQMNLKAELEHRMNLVNKRIEELEAMEAAATTPRRKKNCPKDIAVSLPFFLQTELTEFSFVLQKLIAATMRDLLDMPDPKSVVPGPLAVGEAQRQDENGVIFHNPTWTGNADGTQPLVVSTISLVWENEKAIRTLPEKLGPLNSNMKAMFKTAAIQYWGTLQKRFAAQTTEKGRQRYLRKAKYNVGYGRYKRAGNNQLTSSRRNAIPDFKKKYGEGNCVGLEAIIYSPWASEDGSEPENADPAAFNTRRIATGNRKALEKRCQEWRGAVPNRVYGALDTLARKALVDAQHNVQGGKDRRRGHGKAERFRGFVENAYKGFPKGSRIPYKSCINPAWAEKEGYTGSQDDPADFTIFKLVIDDADLDSEAIALLADVKSA
ncbi:hypothetical protein K438DRAFT_1768297 [Mycena galopus ATCC 62051]|nr:hypothetical protein K438DRAFT_1768297 [Mycena galopus ATCC 62051]